MRLSLTHAGTVWEGTPLNIISQCLNTFNRFTIQRNMNCNILLFYRWGTWKHSTTLNSFTSLSVQTLKFCCKFKNTQTNILKYTFVLQFVWNLLGCHFTDFFFFCHNQRVVSINAVQATTHRLYEFTYALT